MSDESNSRTYYWKIFAADADGLLARVIRSTIGRLLDKMYSPVVEERLPPNTADLLHRLDRPTRVDPGAVTR
jgi:hypothetical protein